MPSPAAFLSSSPAPGASPRKPLTLSSSPDLPSIDDIASQSLAKSRFFQSQSQSHDARPARFLPQHDASPAKLPPTIAAGKSTPKFIPPAEVAQTNASATESKGKGPALETLEPLNLEMADTRRLEWTPPKANSLPVPIDIDGEAPRASGNHTDEEGSIKNLGQVLQAFKHKTDSPPEDVLGKRKLVHCAPIVLPATIKEASKSPPKKKVSKKKKPLTITELATAAYRVPSPPATAAAEAVDNPTKTDANTTKAAGTKAKPKPRKRVSKAKAKKPQPPKQVLLSPTAALQQVSRQDVLFGTSSQLAGEHSPTFLRDLATVMRQSNATGTTPINSDAIEPPPERQSLWEAAARDDDGGLFDLDIIEMKETPLELPAQTEASNPFGYGPSAAAEAEDSFVELSDILEEPSPPSSPPKPLQRTRSPAKATPSPTKAADATTAPTQASQPNYRLYSDAQLTNAVSSFGFRSIKTRNAQIALLEKCWQSKASTQSQGISSSRLMSSSAAHLNPSTPARMRPLTASQASDVSLPENEPPPSAQPVSPAKRPRGRPRKTPVTVSKQPKAKKSTMAETPATPVPSAGPALIEIPDSESENDLKSSPVASQLLPESEAELEPEPSQLTAADMAFEVDADTLAAMNLPPSTQDGAVFDYITSAIRALPPSKDPNNPSWHEKIVMYDPIVIEELATWLNTGALTKLGWDDEVKGADVKRWCESKSICCVWRVNIRGVERKRL